MSKERKRPLCTRLDRFVGAVSGTEPLQFAVVQQVSDGPEKDKGRVVALYLTYDELANLAIRLHKLAEDYRGRTTQETNL